MSITSTDCIFFERCKEVNSLHCSSCIEKVFPSDFPSSEPYYNGYSALKLVVDGLKGRVKELETLLEKYISTFGELD